MPEVIFWLHRIIEEKRKDVGKIMDRIGVLSHQIQHFKSMDVRVQKDVIKEMITDFEKYGWEKYIKDLFDENSELENWYEIQQYLDSNPNLLPDCHLNKEDFCDQSKKYSCSRLLAMKECIRDFHDLVDLGGMDEKDKEED